MMNVALLVSLALVGVEPPADAKPADAKPAATTPAPAPATAPAQPPATPAAPGPGDGKPATPPGASAVPSLDEMLGLAKPGTAPAQPAPTAGHDDLERKLNAAEAQDAFKEAVELMGQTAARLSPESAGGGDTSLATQRAQEEILRKLDGVISQARKQQQKQKSQKSQQQSKDQQDKQNQQQPDQPDQQDPQEQQRQREAQMNEQNKANGENRNQLPAFRMGMRPGLEAAKAAWGGLPDRVREMLLQGAGEKFSNTYERLTEEYYKKLAEKKE